MSTPRESLRNIVYKEHHPLVGFLVCFILAFIIQLIGIGILIAIAGGITGFLLKRDVKAILVTFAAGTAVWGSFFIILFVLYPQASIAAWVLLSQVFPAPQLLISLLGGVICGIGGEVGVIVSDYFRPPPEYKIQPRKPRPPEPKPEIPRRRRVKRRKRKKKKRSA
ncbi:MAG: hypothetical protein ACFFCO_07280 [Promethearchaeota archaeon]